MKRLAAILAFLISPAVASAADITQARYLTPSQFLHSLTQVSLRMRASGETIADYLPLDIAQGIVKDALANHGIAVRPNAPVALEVELGDLRGTAGETVIHDIFLTMDFYVRGAVLRNGKFHTVPVSVASAWYTNAIFEPSDLQRALLRATTTGRIRQLFADGVASNLKTIESINTASTVQWPPSTWTDAQKAQANLDFAKAIRPDAPMEPGVVVDVLDVVPALNLKVDAKVDICKLRPSLSELWSKEFQQLKSARTVAQPSVSLEHVFSCNIEKFPEVEPLIRLLQHVYLTEANVLFEVNGEVFRQSAVLHASRNLGAVDVKDDAQVDHGWIQKRTEDFVRGTFSDILLHPNRPALPGTALTNVTKSSPDAAPTGRLILGEDVRLERGSWRYANGTEVPATLLDKATGTPPLRPKSQHPVTQPPVSIAVVDIKSTLSAIKSCQLYTTPSKENLLWSVLSPSFELDDTGVMTSRYALSTRPGQPYAQGASIANLSLLAAQIQDRGGCKVLTIPCKGGQCVRFEENANPSLNYFVETMEQANKILNSLKVIAPFYPDGAGQIRR